MNKFKILALAAALTVFGTACEDLLDTDPKQSLTPETTLVDIAGYKAVMNAMYRATLGFGLYGQQLMVDPEILADNLVIHNNTNRFVAEWVNASGAHVNIWTASYTIINYANTIIATIDDVEGDAAEKNEIKGHALFMRALMYHNMVKTYAYEPGREVNGFTQGVVLRTTPTTVASDADLRSRASNVEVYDQIEMDLVDAIGLLPATSMYTTTPHLATKAAAKALMARVKLYRQDWGGAVTYATEAMAETTATLTTAENHVASFKTAVHPESIFEIEIRATDWNSVDGVNESLSSMTGTTAGAQFTIAGSQDLYDQMEEGDVRRNLWIYTNDQFEDYQSLKWPGEKGNYLENIPVIRYSEMLLTRAEAYANQATGAADARADLNRLRANRGLEAVDENLSGDALVQAILNERRIELALEGHRFYDLKRNGMTVPKPNAPGIERVQYSDYRILSPIPFTQVTLNPNLDQNPSY